MQCKRNRRRLLSSLFRRRHAAAAFWLLVASLAQPGCVGQSGSSSPECGIGLAPCGGVNPECGIGLAPCRGVNPECVESTCVERLVVGEVAPSGLAVTESGDLYWLSRTLGPRVLTVRHLAPGARAAETMVGTIDPPGEVPPSLAYGDGTLYYGNGSRADGGGRVIYDQLDASLPIDVAPRQDVPSSVAADEAWVVWTNQEGGSVAAARHGGAPAFSLAAGEPRPASVALASGMAVWANTAAVPGAVRARPLDGGPAITLLDCGASNALCAPTAVGAYAGGVMVALRGGLVWLSLGGNPSVVGPRPVDGGTLDVHHFAPSADSALYFSDTAGRAISVVVGYGWGIKQKSHRRLVSGT